MITDLHPDNLKIWQDNDMELKRYEYRMFPGDVIIDMGAYQGDWSVQMHSRYLCNTIMFEPVPILNHFFGIPWATVVHKAAWINNGLLTFGGNAYWTSTQLDDNPQVYPCADVSEYINSEIAVCKINIEGCEYEVLNHLIDTGKIGYLRNIQVQFHMIEGHELKYQYLAERLSKTHKISWQVQWIWENWEKL